MPILMGRSRSQPEIETARSNNLLLSTAKRVAFKFVRRFESRKSSRKMATKFLYHYK